MPGNHTGWQQVAKASHAYERCVTRVGSPYNGKVKAGHERLSAPEAIDGIALAEAVQSGIEEIQRRFGLTSAMAERLVKWLTAEESRLFELETLIPTDALQVELKIDGQYRSLDRLSVGQRATGHLASIICA